MLCFLACLKLVPVLTEHSIVSNEQQQRQLRATHSASTMADGEQQNYQQVKVSLINHINEKRQKLG
jgi:hypothetical protein